MEATATVVAHCRRCGEFHELQPTIAGYIAWHNGVLIQDAMPELSASERELLISGTCGKCFDELFGLSSDEE
jgi:hypothetical protein